jgi:hypothetical protein
MVIDLKIMCKFFMAILSQKEKQQHGSCTRAFGLMVITNEPCMWNGVYEEVINVLKNNV